MPVKNKIYKKETKKYTYNTAYAKEGNDHSD